MKSVRSLSHRKFFTLNLTQQKKSLTKPGFPGFKVCAAMPLGGHFLCGNDCKWLSLAILVRRQTEEH